MTIEDVQSYIAEKSINFSASLNFSKIGGLIAGVIGLLMLLILILGFVWDSEPDTATLQDILQETNTTKVTGSATVATMIHLTDVLLSKPGGYLTNDILPPGLFMDNLPNWELGVVTQLRDLTRTLRSNMSRSQSQSQEDPDLIDAEQSIFFARDRWLWPDTEGKFRDAAKFLNQYLVRLSDADQRDAQFYARADNLRAWLAEVETRLGSLSQRLSASVGKRQLNIDLAGDSAATQSTATEADLIIKTPWSELDDVFYEARGTTWALIQLLTAIEVDFEDVLRKKNALVSLQQITRELESTQDSIWSPMILNGSGFGFLANHSLVMASHISRANAALIDLRSLLEQG